MEMETDADMTAMRLAKLGIMPSKEHMAAMSSKARRTYALFTAQETNTPFSFSFKMKSLTVWLVTTEKCWELIILSPTFCHVDSTTFPLDVSMYTAIGWCESREDW